MFSTYKYNTQQLLASQRFKYHPFQYFNNYEKSSKFNKDMYKNFINCQKTSVLNIYHPQSEQSNKQQNKEDNHNKPTIQQKLQSITQLYEQMNHFEQEHVLNQNSYKINPICQISKEQIIEQIDAKKIDSFYLRVVESELKSQQFQQKSSNFINYLNSIKTLILSMQSSYQQTKIENRIRKKIKLQRLIENIIQQSMYTRKRNHLIMYTMDVNIFEYYQDPLLDAIYAFIQKNKQVIDIEDKSQQKHLPNLIYINLLGYENPFNLICLKQILSYYPTLLYISIYFDDQNENDKIKYDFSEYLHNAVLEINKDKEKVNLIALPINSLYIKDKLDKSQYNGLFRGTSEEILLLFEIVLFEIIEYFHSDIIFVNYNQNLNINQHHFECIIKKLTTFSDHRIILFTNIINLDEIDIHTDVQSILREQEFVGEIQQKHITYFYKLYRKLYQVNINYSCFIEKVLMFAKLSSGVFELDVLPKGCQLIHDWIGYQYLQNLSQIEGYHYLRKHISNQSESSKIKLFNKLEIINLNKNIEQKTERYKKFLNSLVQKFDIEKNSIFSFQKRMLSSTKLKLVFQEMIKKLQYNFIQRQRIQKSYFSRRANIKDLIEVKFIDQFKNRVQLEKFTQVIYWNEDQKNIYVFIINVLSSKLSSKQNFKWYFGKVQNSIAHLDAFNLQNLNRQSNNWKINILYSYTFYRHSIYLFWPLEWDFTDEVFCKLLGVEYRPKQSNQILRIKINVNPLTVSVLKLQTNYSNSVPRFKSSGFAVNQKLLYIFGGIYIDLQQRLQSSTSMVNKIQISQNLAQIDVINTSATLQEKMSYEVAEKKNEKIIVIFGGVGYRFSNSFRIFNHEVYQFNYKNGTLAKTVQKVNISIMNSYEIKSAGYFNLIKQSVINQLFIQKKFSNSVKHKITVDSYVKMQKLNPDFRPLTFYDPDFVFRYKQNYDGYHLKAKKQSISLYRNKKYLPELFLYDDNHKMVRLEILLQKQDKSSQFKFFSNFFPKSESIVSLHFDNIRNNLMLLTPPLTFMEKDYCIYQGQLQDREYLIDEGNIKLKQIEQIKLNFKLESKVIFHNHHYFLICGGTTDKQGCRTDLMIIQQSKKYKVSKIELRHAIKDVLNMQNGFLIEYKPQQFYMYCLAKDQTLIKLQSFSTIKNLKVKRKIRMVRTKIFELLTQNDKIIHKLSNNKKFDKIVSIVKHKPFSQKKWNQKINNLFTLLNKQDVLQKLSIKLSALQNLKKHNWTQTQMVSLMNHLQEYYQYLNNRRIHQPIIYEILINIRSLIAELSKFQLERYLSLENRLNLYRFVIQSKQNVIFVAFAQLNVKKLSFFQFNLNSDHLSFPASHNPLGDFYSDIELFHPNYQAKINKIPQMFGQFKKYTNQMQSESEQYDIDEDIKQY